MQAAQPFGNVRDSADGHGALIQRMPVSTWAQTGWYCCVQISGRGSRQVTKGAAGAGAASTGRVAAGAFTGGAARSSVVPPGLGGRVVQQATSKTKIEKGVHDRVATRASIAHGPPMLRLVAEIPTPSRGGGTLPGAFSRRHKRVGWVVLGGLGFTAASATGMYYWLVFVA